MDARPIECLVNVAYGPHDLDLPLAGCTEAEIKESLADVLNVGKAAEAYVNGQPVRADYVLQAGDRIEWMRESGSKGAWDRSWCHAPTDDPPQEFPHGPLSGSLTELASWLTQYQSNDGRWVRKMQTLGLIWVRKFHERLYEVWLKDAWLLDRANERRTGFKQ